MPRRCDTRHSTSARPAPVGAGCSRRRGAAGRGHGVSGPGAAAVSVPRHTVSGVSRPQERTWRSERPLQPGPVLAIFRRGAGDPTFRVLPDGAIVRAVVTPQGAATVEVRVRAADAEVGVRAWGPGADWALAQAPRLLGEDDDPAGFVPRHRPVAQALRRFAGWRVPRSGLVVDALVPAVIEQRVTGQEAFGGFRRLVRRYGQPAPGPHDGLLVPPDAGAWRAIPSWEWLRCSVDGSRSGTVLRALQAAPALERLARLPGPEARARLRSVPGIGPWTAAEVAQRALGDADAVSFGDYHVARNVGWALLGQELDDAGLATLLEPYAGHRYRVQRLLELAGRQRPRRGPRLPPRTHLPR